MLLRYSVTIIIYHYQLLGLSVSASICVFIYVYFCICVCVFVLHTQIQGCLRASAAVMRLLGLMVSILLIRSLASGVTVSHSGEGNCQKKRVLNAHYTLVIVAKYRIGTYCFGSNAKARRNKKNYTRKFVKLLFRKESQI